MDQHDNFIAQLLAAFGMEAEEHFSSISSGLLDWENTADPAGHQSLLETIFRAFHSLKGASRAVDLRDIEAVCQSAESLLALAKRDESLLSTKAVDIMLRSVDAMRASLNAPSPQVTKDLLAFGDSLTNLLAERNGSPARQEPEPPKPAANAGGRTRLTFTDRKPPTDVEAPKPPTLPARPERVTISRPSAVSQPMAAPPPASAPQHPAAPPPAPAPHHPAAPLRLPPKQSEAPPQAVTRSDRAPAVAPEVNPVPSYTPPQESVVESGIAPRTTDESVEVATRDRKTIAPTAPQETIKVSADRLDAVLMRVEELLSLKLTSAHRASRLKEIEAAMTRSVNVWLSLASDARVFESTYSQSAPADAQARKFTEAISKNVGFLKQLTTEISELSRSADGDARQIDAQVEELLEDSKKLLMLPIGTALRPVPRMVRDIGRDLGKDIGVEMHGEETDIDKRILDLLKDPVLHIVRNCVDHGIEMPEVREQRSKPRKGQIQISVAALDSSRIEILIEDDGGGINLDRLRRVALKQGIVSEETLAAMDDDAVAGLIFHSGISTSAIVTDLSGRGLGMAIARDMIEDMGGRINVSSFAGAGTLFRIVLPVSHTTLRCILVRIAGRSFMIPANNVERACRVNKDQVKYVAHCKTIMLEDEAVAIVDLAAVLGVTRSPIPSGLHVQAIVLTGAGARIAFQVDEIVAEQETLVKQLGSLLPHVRHMAGAALLGAGEAVPILNVRDLLVTAQTMSASAGTLTVASEDENTEPRRILVVDDSVTSRMLIKNILEAVGYNVNVAVDGVEALAALKADEFDLVVSDVEMPRMDGFTLTENLRKDPRLAQMPVILVTSLESREHKERGVAAGANAYIVKRTFDQGNLLETVQRFI